MGIPCEQCLLIPICKGKAFFKLRFECSLLRDTLYFKRTSKYSEKRLNFDKKLILLEKILKPDRWETMEVGHGIYVSENL